MTQHTTREPDPAAYAAEDQKPGSPPRPATEPSTGGAGGSAKTLTDPATGETTGKAKGSEKI